jgi:hypothetical protein
MGRETRAPGMSVLRHVRHTFLCEGEIGMMRKKVKKLDKNHLEMVHLDTWESTTLFTNHPKTCV